MVWIGTYIASLAAFLVIDAIWLTLVMKPLFDRHIGHMLRDQIALAPAAGFYLLYVVGVLYFCTAPALKDGAVMLAVVNGAILGFMAYGTYEFTSMTTLKGWAWPMVITDIAWGMFLTAGVAAIGFLVARVLGGAAV